MFLPDNVKSVWGGNFFGRFRKMCPESSPGCCAVLQQPCCLGKRLGPLRKHVAKPWEQVAAPDFIDKLKVVKSNVPGCSSTACVILCKTASLADPTAAQNPPRRCPGRRFNSI